MVIKQLIDIMQSRTEQYILIGSLKACKDMIPVDTLAGDEYTMLYENCFSKYKEALSEAHRIMEEMVPKPPGSSRPLSK